MNIRLYTILSFVIFAVVTAVPQEANHIALEHEENVLKNELVDTNNEKDTIVRTLEELSEETTVLDIVENREFDEKIQDDLLQLDNSSTPSTLKYVGKYIQGLCVDLLENETLCEQLVGLLKEENYLRLTWELTHRLFFERPFGVVMFLVWTALLCFLNFSILFLCAFLKPLRSFLLTKIVSDLRRRYYFTNESSEMRIIDNNQTAKK
ncbi:hypothetical protein [Drosophila suzukii associated hytrosavirus 1]|nr:hypothetical protein [Drosophila suzukii associated hytrosavirus 1]